MKIFLEEAELGLKKPVIILTGPTASGKTGVSIELAELIGAEIIGADSMQIYRGLKIASASPDENELSRVKHHLIGVVDPGIKFSVAMYYELAKAAISDIQSKGKMPLIVGGTGLYIDSLIYEMDFSGQIADEEYRKELLALANVEGKSYIYNMLKENSPKRAEELHENDVKRVIRALEIIKHQGADATIKDKERINRIKRSDFNTKVFCLSPPRDELYKRINLRVEKMFDEGIIKEVQAMKSFFKSGSTAFEYIGYKEISAFLDGDCTLLEAKQKMMRNSRRYAKRQLTWFRKMNCIWVEPDRDPKITAERIASLAGLA